MISSTSWSFCVRSGAYIALLRLLIVSSVNRSLDTTTRWYQSFNDTWIVSLVFTCFDETKVTAVKRIDTLVLIPRKIYSRLRWNGNCSSFSSFSASLDSWLEGGVSSCGSPRSKYSFSKMKYTLFVFSLQWILLIFDVTRKKKPMYLVSSYREYPVEVLY